MIDGTSLTISACFFIGLMSTLHCWGMCGGVATLLGFGIDNSKNASKPQIIFTAAIYNFGRIFSYGMIGLMLGLISHATLEQLFSGSGHVYLQLFSSVLLILIAFQLLGVFSRFTMLEKIGTGIWKKIQPISQLFLPVDSPLKAFMLGLVWGWLPCGMVYSVLLLSMTAGGAVESMSYMLAFGFGTLPGMMMASIASRGFKHYLNLKGVRYLFGSLIIAMAIAVPVMSWQTSNVDHSEHMHHH